MRTRKNDQERTFAEQTLVLGHFLLITFIVIFMQLYERKLLFTFKLNRVVKNTAQTIKPILPGTIRNS